MAKVKSPEWASKAIAASQGLPLGLILVAALETRGILPDGFDTSTLPRRLLGKPRFDEYRSIRCDSINERGFFMQDTYVGGLSDVVDTMDGLAIHLALNAAQKKAFFAIVQSWVRRRGLLAWCGPPSITVLVRYGHYGFVYRLYERSGFSVPIRSKEYRTAAMALAAGNRARKRFLSNRESTNGKA